MDKAGQNLINISMAYRYGKVSEPIMPSSYVIEPTNVCNYKCIMCPNQLYKAEEKGYMDWSLYQTIVEQIKDTAKSVLLYWVGESIFHPRLFEMIALLKKKSNACVTLSTNASLLSKQVAEQLTESELDEIIIALDANSQESYEDIRIGGKWKNVIQNIEDFFVILGESKTPRPILQLIKMHKNAGDVEGFIQRWSEYPCEPLVTWLDTWAGQFPEMEDWSDYMCPNYFENRKACSELWFKMVIGWQGKVSICCHDWRRENIIGDIREQSILDIWNSKPITKVRQDHQNQVYGSTPICKSCKEWSLEEEQYEFFSLSPEEQNRLQVSYSKKPKT